MGRTIQKSIRSLMVFTLLTGVIYPLAVTGIAQWLASRPANGSMITINGKTIGSALIGQKFSKPEYFWGRPSSSDYGTMPSGASNFSPTSQKLKERLITSMKELGIDPASDNKPYDLLLASGSGLDPDISPESAEFQVSRVSRIRGIDALQLRALIRESTEAPFLDLIGRPRVNVLQLNLALDKLKR